MARQEETHGVERLNREALDVPVRVTELLEGPIANLGYTLLEVQYRAEGAMVLRLLIETQGADGLSLNGVAEVSELASRLLDVEDPIPGEFNLEVSSPGLFRELREPRHFAQSLGKLVRLSLAPDSLPEHKNRILRGILREAGEDAATVEEVVAPAKGKGRKVARAGKAPGPEQQGAMFRVPYAGIQKARLDPDL